jgi:hypothetical protein
MLQCELQWYSSRLFRDAYAGLKTHTHVHQWRNLYCYARWSEPNLR